MAAMLLSAHSCVCMPAQVAQKVSGAWGNVLVQWVPPGCTSVLCVDAACCCS